MKDKAKCYGKFPVIAVLILILAILWVLSELKIVVLNVPWLPIIIGLVALKMVIYHSKK